MKGVSEVIAIILILMIVIALAALAYTWFSGIFASLTGTAGVAVTTTTQTMVTTFEIEQAKYIPNTLYVYIRNVGIQNFNASTGVVSIYIDNVVTGTLSSTVGFTPCAGTGSMLDKGCVASYRIDTLPAGAVYCSSGTGSASANATKVTIGTGLTNIANIMC